MSEAATLIVGPIVMGLAAVGVLILIKTRRRLQGTRDSRYTDVVPVNPMSAEHARRVRQRYLLIAGIVAAGLVLVLLIS
jgi:hypothetical protein